MQALCVFNHAEEFSILACDLPEGPDAIAARALRAVERLIGPAVKDFQVFRVIREDGYADAAGYGDFHAG